MTWRLATRKQVTRRPWHKYCGLEAGVGGPLSQTLGGDPRLGVEDSLPSIGDLLHGVEDPWYGVKDPQHGVETQSVSLWTPSMKAGARSMIALTSVTTRAGGI